MRNLAYLLIITLFTILSSYFVYAAVESAIPVVTVISPVVGANLTISNGTTTSLVVIVNVSSNSSSNITNVTVFIMNSANATVQAIVHNASMNASQQSNNGSTFNFTIVNANISGRTDGIRNYSFNAYATTAVSNGTLTNAVGNGTNVNITIDNTAPTVTINNANATNQTTASFTLNITVSDNLFNADGINLTYNFTCTAYSGTDKITQTNATFRISNATVFPANATMTQRLHKINATCTDSVGINGSSSLLDLTVDTTQPTNANITFASKIVFGKNTTLTCSGSDVISNTSNATLYIEPAGFSGFRFLANSTTNNVTFDFKDTRALGIYSANCSIIDYSGLQNSTTLTFEVVRGVSDAEYVPAKRPVAKKIIGSGRSTDIGSLETTDARLMAKDSKLIFTINGEEHSVYVKDLKESSATIVVESEPVEAVLNVGDSKEFDVNADGVNDISVKLNGVFRGKADLFFTNLGNVPAEKPGVVIPEEQPPVSEEPTFTAVAKSTLLTIIIALAVLLVLIYLYMKFRSGKGKVAFTPKDLGSQRPEDYNYPTYPKQEPVKQEPQQPSTYRYPTRNDMQQRSPDTQNTQSQNSRYSDSSYQNRPYSSNNQQKPFYQRYPER